MSKKINNWLDKLWTNDEGQDVAEYSVMLAVILVIVVGTIRLIGSNAGNIFSHLCRKTCGKGGGFSFGLVFYCPTVRSILLATFTPLNPFTYFAIPR
jgi:Flp pilus assembly pilin Flp